MLTESSYIPDEAQDYQVPPEAESNPEKNESRFGKKEAILEILSHCPEEEILNLGELIANAPETTAESTNRVELAQLAIPDHLKHLIAHSKEKAQSTNSVIPYVVVHEGQAILCIFKPADGEKHTHQSGEAERFYPQEAGMYQISEAFELDLVPPTIVRTIQGRKGSLQLYIDPMEYALYEVCGEENKIPMTHEEESKLKHSKEIQSIALLDTIGANIDRHYNNWAIKIKPKAETAPAGDDNLYTSYEVDYRENNDVTCVCYDHGETLRARRYALNAVKGPSRWMTDDGDDLAFTGEELDQGIPKDTPIPSPLLDKLQAGLAHEDELSDALQAIDIPAEEIIFMWMRVHALKEEKVFISNRNRNHLDIPVATFAHILRNHIHRFGGTETSGEEDLARPLFSLTPHEIETVQNLKDTDVRFYLSLNPRDIKENPFVRENEKIIRAVRALHRTEFRV